LAMQLLILCFHFPLLPYRRRVMWLPVVILHIH